MRENQKLIARELKSEDEFLIPGEEFVIWNSRSMAVTLIVCSPNKDNTNLAFLIEKRGPGCPDNIGKYVFPCGYINWDERLREAAVRELYEETGLKVDPKELKFAGVNDDPEENRQNITMRYVYFYPDFKTLSEEFDRDVNIDTKSRGGEGGECSEILIVDGNWIKEHKDEFAFNHANLCLKLLDNLEKIKEGEFYWDSLS